MSIENYKNYNLKTNDISNVLISVIEKINHEDLIKSESKKSKYLEKFFANNFKIKDGKIEILKKEHKLHDEKNDKVDLYAKIVIGVQIYHLIIEMDNMRADQVTKKLFSRPLLLSSNDEIIYVSLLYSTKSNISQYQKECKTYIKGHYKDFIDRNTNIQYLSFVPQACL